MGEVFSLAKTSQVLGKHLFIMRHKEIFSLLQLLLALPKGKMEEFQWSFNWAFNWAYPGPQSRGFVLTRTWCSRPRWSSSTVCKKALVFYDDSQLNCATFPTLTSNKQSSLIIHRYSGRLSIVPYMKFCVLSGIMIGLFS